MNSNFVGVWIAFSICDASHPLRGSLGRLGGASLGREVSAMGAVREQMENEFFQINRLNRRGGAPSGAAELSQRGDGGISPHL